MTEPRSIADAGAGGQAPLQKRAHGSISYGRDQLLDLSASPLAAASIPDPGRLANFAPIFASSTLSDGASHSYLGAPGPNLQDLTGGLASLNMMGTSATDTPILKPVPDKAIFRQITSLVDLDPSLMKPVTAGELEVHPEMEQSVENLARVQQDGGNSDCKSMEVEVIDADAGDWSSRRASLRPEANPFVPGQQDATPNSLDGTFSALAKPIHALPERPTLCAMQPNLPRWALSPSNAALGSIASEFTMSPPRLAGIQQEQQDSNVAMQETSSWRSGAPVRDRMMSGSGGGGNAYASAGHLQLAEDRRASQSMTPWARRGSASDQGVSQRATLTASRSITAPLGPGQGQRGNPPAFAAFTFGTKDNSLVDASVRNLPLGGRADGSSVEMRIPGSVSSSVVYAMGSYGAGGAVRVPRRPSMGDVLEEGSARLLGAVPMQGPGTYK